MAVIQLGFGKDSIPSSFDESRFVILGNQERVDAPLSDAEINQAIESPIDSPPLEEILSPGDSVLIVVSDATRATASAEVVNLLVRRLIAGGIAPFDIRVILRRESTGP
jgi:nickel-dependent lactate racemase